jgi:hypothetical protein
MLRTGSATKQFFVFQKIASLLLCGAGPVLFSRLRIPYFQEKAVLFSSFSA